MKRIMQTFCILIFLAMVVAGCSNNEQIAINTGSKTNSQLQLKDNKTEFKLGEPIYYTISATENLKESITIQVLVNRGKDTIQKEELKIDNAKYKRPVNPINVSEPGKYSIVVKNGKDTLSEKEINVKK